MRQITSWMLSRAASLSSRPSGVLSYYCSAWLILIQLCQGSNFYRYFAVQQNTVPLGQLSLCAGSAYTGGQQQSLRLTMLQKLM